MESETERFRVEHAAMLARSAQGLAAKGMKIKDQEDMWVSIQHNTFRNWINVQLRETGLKVENLSEDLRDGVALVTLVETLQKRKLRKVARVLNQHQALENVSTALNAISDDGIKLVNIGNVDIVNGNLKLILGLIWSLIMHYQIGQTKFPPKKLMLSWFKAALPSCEVNNFTSNWNSGVNLCALVDYCRPGLFRSWKNLDPNNSVENCRKAMEIASQEFNIPMVLEPEYLASPYLDDLSGMTYLSYFIKDGGPGYKATLDWIQKTLPEKSITNFTTDWNDGHNLATLVKKLGGPVPGYKTMSKDPKDWEKNIQVAQNGARKLGIEPTLSPSDMARSDVESLGTMAYLSYFQWVRPRKGATESIRVSCDVENTRINNQVPFRIDFLSKDVVESELRVDVNGPSGPVRVDIDSSPRGARGSFTPKKVGFYELSVMTDGEHVEGSPYKVRALPDVNKIMFSGIDPCAIGSIVEVLINSNGAGGGDIDVMALSPTRRSLACPVKEDDGVYTATFQPDEAGEWSIEVTYDNEHIQGSPFSCHVYDPHAIKVHHLEDGPRSSPGKPFTFLVDASACGWGDANIDVTNDGKSVLCKTLEVDRSVYEVTFTPLEATKYKVYVYFNGHESKGSPFPLYLGVEKPPERKSSKSKKKSSKSKQKAVTPIVKEYTSVVDHPKHTNDSLSRKNLSKASFDSTLSSSKKYSSLHKSYESRLDDTNTPSIRNYTSSLTRTKTSPFNRSSDSLLNKDNNDIFSRDYSKTLNKFKDRTRTLSFDFPTQTTTFDIPVSDRLDPYSNSTPNRRSPNHDPNFNTFHTSSFNSSTDSTFNTVSTTVIDSGYSSSKKSTSASYDKHVSRRGSPPHIHNNYIGVRSPKSPVKRSPVESSIPLGQTTLPSSSPEPIPGLSSLSKVLHANTLRNSENVDDRKIMSSYSNTVKNETLGRSTKSEYEEFHISNYPTPTIRTRTQIYKNEDRLISSPSSASPTSPCSPLSPVSPPPLSYSSPIYTSSSLRKTILPSSKSHFAVTTSSAPNVSNLHYSSSLRNESINVPVQVTYSHGSLTSPTHRSRVSTNTFNSRTWEQSGYRDHKKDHQSINKSTIDITDSATSNFEERASVFGDRWRTPRSEIDPKKVSVGGASVRMVMIGETAKIKLRSPQQLWPEDVDVKITGPARKVVPWTVEEGDKLGEVIVCFKPLIVGEYFADVQIKEERIPGSPFRCYLYDAREIKVARIPDGVVGQPVEFEIDGSMAGSGNLEILVNGGHVTSNVRNLGDQRFLASFIPHSSIPHSVEMKFNEEQVPGSPWNVSVMESQTARVSVMGEAIRHFPAGQLSSFDVSAPGIPKEDIQVHIVSPAKRPVSYQLKETSEGIHQVSFATSEVGSYVVEVVVSGQKVQGSPFIAKAYDAGLIRVSDVPNGVVGQPCQFRVDASQAGEGQLEISINDGEVPNHVQVLGGGRCLVSFTPDTAKTHTIDIKFNGETVRGCPFVCRVSDTSRVSLTLRHLELIPVGQPAAFNITVDRGGSAELTVTVRTPSHTTLPVRVSGNVRQGFSAEFTPVEVGAHTIIVNYNDLTVSGTPFTCKVYDPSKVGVSHLPRGAIGKTLQFIVDASEAGEGNLEISISAVGRNIPTQVHPQGSARFAVAFVPLEAIDHIINISFNKEPVPGSPFVAKVQADPNRIVVSGQALAATAVNKTSFFTISNVTGSVEDVEVSVEGASGMPVAAQVRDNKDGTFRVEYSPRATGEHRIHVSYAGENIPGSPFCCKVYDVNAIKVRPAERGMVGKPVTFLVETNNAGPGNLEVTVNGGQVPTGAQAQGNHVYAISFTPKEAKPHVVELSFNGENVPGSPFTCTVVDVSRVTVSGAGLEKVPVDSVASFIVDTQATVDQLNVNILSPSRNVVTPQILAIGGGKIKVEYTPTEVGDHGLEIRVGGVLVPGAPFLVKAYDSSKVKVMDVTSGVVAKPVYFSIDASQAGAGNLEIIVSVNGRNVPNYVQSEGHARFRVNFKPKEAAVHTLSVKFNGEPVPGSPFECRVTDSSNVLVSGNGIKMTSLAQSAVFYIDSRGAEIGECDIQVTSPSGARVPVRKNGELPKKMTVEFQPLEVGPHTVNIYLDGESVGGSPFTCNVYDVTKVNVTGLENTKVNRPVTFTVDASQAGEGTLELVVTTAKSSVRAEVAARSRGLYDVTFTPHESIAHFVNITFNEEEVLGSPFKCEVRELEPREVKNLKRKESQMVTAKGEGLKQVVAGNLASFTVDTKGLEGEIDIHVIGPNNEQIPAKLVKMRNGLHRAEYRVMNSGSYNVAVLHQNVPISGTPYLVEAADPKKVQLNASQCFSEQECSLRVDASNAGRGSLSVGVKAAGQEIKHSIRDLGGGMYQVLFYPNVPIPHKVDVRYNGISIEGGPFEIPVRNPASGQAVTATGLGLHHSRVVKAASFVIETMNRPSKEFDVIITGPHDWAVPVKCYQQKDGNLLAEYTPHTPGNYQIDVLCSGKHVKGSPFTCSAYDASKVVFEEPKANISVEEVWVFKMDKSEAGVADMDVQVIDPSGRICPLELKSTPTHDIVEWQPESPGQYKVEVSYGGEEVPGSPIYLDVGESGLPSVSGTGLVSGKIDTPCAFTIDGRGLLGQPQVTVDGPDSVARVTIRQQHDGFYQVTYVPHEVGIFDIRVQWNKKDVPGSPFHPKVVDLKKVRLIGGWESLGDEEGKLDLIPREERRLTFDLSEAGPGRLKSEVVHDGKIIEGLVEQNGSRFRLIFTPPTEGQYELNFWYNDLLLPQCPVKGWVPSTTTGDHTRVTLRGHGLTSARCGAEAEFTIDGSGAGHGTPDVTMSGTKTDIHVGLASEGNGVWHAKYIPLVAGAYLLNVMWNDRQVRGCPLKVIVESVADSSKVLCSGDGLRHGMVGQEIKSFIDTRRAGPGELSARCVGPHKVAVCELYDHRDGTFTLNIRPHEPGRHHLTVMYEGEHVSGSPYTLKIAGAPDASKVRVYGPGIEHGVLASYQSRFICDTRGAGAGQLTVKIRGPKGAFRVEMQRESQKDRTILCKYDPTEPGDYRVEVKWSGENVPGSPFVVMIFDTQEELNRYMAGGYSPSGPGGAPSDNNYGSIGYGYGAVNFGQMSWRGSQAQL